MSQSQPHTRWVNIILSFQSRSFPTVLNLTKDYSGYCDSIVYFQERLCCILSTILRGYSYQQSHGLKAHPTQTHNLQCNYISVNGFINWISTFRRNLKAINVFHNKTKMNTMLEFIDFIFWAVITGLTTTWCT